MNATSAPPPDVFVSYARANRPLVEQLAQGLGASGLQVWWDRDLLAGAEFAAVIELKLQGAAVVVVLWSADSVHSSFVRDESSRALKQGKLLPVRIENVELPLGFGQLHTLDLLDWDGDASDDRFQKLLFEVRQHQPQAPAMPPAPPRPRRRWLARSTRMTAVALALALGGGAWYLREQQQTEADRHFLAGLDQQYASVPRLETALNEYLSALELRPEHARANYYLGHVYAQTGKPADAFDSFKRALAATEAPLSRSQRSDAEKQLLTLARVEGEAAPITRVAANPVPAKPAPMGGVGIESGLTAAPGAAVRPGAPGAPRLPLRIDPPEARVALLTQGVEDLFDKNKERRINTTTSLVLDARALSDAVPLAVQKALQVLKGGPSGLDASASAGVFNTLVLLKSASPGTLQVNRPAIEQLLQATEPLDDYIRKQADNVRDLVKQAAARKPVAYIEIANEAQRPMAEALASKLRSFGYDTPAIELVGERAPKATQLRVQGKSDRGYARWISKVVGEAIDTQPATSGLHNVSPRTDTYEIWFGRQLCAPGGVQIARCKGA